jgi:hypothetical protein
MLLFKFWNHPKELENRNLEILSSGFERIPQITKNSLKPKWQMLKN